MSTDPKAQIVLQMQKEEKALAADQQKVFQIVKYSLDLLMHQGCIYCWWMEQTGKEAFQKGPHEFKKCYMMDQAEGEEYSAWKKTLVYPPGTVKGICWICHVPSFNDHLHGPFGGPAYCGTFIDIIPPTVFFAFKHHQDLLERHFCIKWPSLFAFKKWLCQPPKVKLEVSNVVSCFIAWMSIAEKAGWV